LKKLSKQIIILSIAIASLFIVSAAAQARPSYQVQLQPLESCLSCHTNRGGGGSLNSFGQDWASNGRQFKKIAKKDSDGDGFTNEREIKDKTLPGDPESNRDARPSYLLIGSFVLGAIAIIAGIWTLVANSRKDNS